MVPYLYDTSDKGWHMCHRIKLDTVNTFCMILKHPVLLMRVYTYNLRSKKEEEERKGRVMIHDYHARVTVC